MPRRSLRLRVHEEAKQDLIAGRDWYADRSFVAAEVFLDEVEDALALIREAPDRWPLFRRGMRRFVMASYPYSIIYRATGTTVDVYAVAHAKRRPEYWRMRRF